MAIKWIVFIVTVVCAVIDHTTASMVVSEVLEQFINIIFSFIKKRRKNK